MALAPIPRPGRAAFRQIVLVEPVALGPKGRTIGIAATLEELVYRCLLFRLLERAWGTRLALVIQAVLFALQHVENVEQGGISDVVTMLASVTLVGLLWAGVFVLARNLWVVAANHAAWNFTILVSGLPLSGIEDWRKLAPLESRFAGPDWLTGGMFGPESSLLVIASTTVAVVLLYDRLALARVARTADHADRSESAALAAKHPVASDGAPRHR